MKYETEKYEDVFSYKVINRTYEFTSIVKNSDNKKQLIQSKKPRQSKFTDFLKVSRTALTDLAQTAEKLESLNLILANYDEENEGRVLEIQDVIKQDITALKKDLEKLEQYVKKQTTYTKQSKLHLQAIVLNLKTRFVSLSSEFKNTLQTQKEILTKSKANFADKHVTSQKNNGYLPQHKESNVSNFNNQQTIDNYNSNNQQATNIYPYNSQQATNIYPHNNQQATSDYRHQGTAQPILAPHNPHYDTRPQGNPLFNHSFQNHQYNNNQHYSFNNQNASHSNQYPRSHSSQNLSQSTAINFDASSFHHSNTNTYTPQQQMLRQRRGADEVVRAEDEVGAIEQTIVELGGIFQQLATMVQEQADVVCRIDSNVDEGALNIEEGHGELVKYLRSISKMRSLMLKIFIILIAIFVFFSYMLV